MSDPQQLTAPTTNVSAAPNAALCINEVWLAILVGLLEPLTHRAAWRGTESEIDNATQQTEILMSEIGKFISCP
jgi:hypothetical protein